VRDEDTRDKAGRRHDDHKDRFSVRRSRQGWLSRDERMRGS